MISVQWYLKSYKIKGNQTTVYIESALIIIVYIKFYKFLIILCKIKNNANDDSDKS